MARRFSTRPVDSEDFIYVIKVEKSGGCVDRDATYLAQLRQAQIREYFFGDFKNTLSPHTQVLDFAFVSVYKAAEGSLAYNAIVLQVYHSSHC